jgi:hypothetical protein
MAFALVSGLLPAALLIALATILVRRRLYVRFPFFLAYSVYSILATAVGLSVIGQPATFFVVYWSTQMLYGVLALLAISEVFMPVPEWYVGRAWSRLLLLLALVGIAGVSAWRAIYHPIGHRRLSGFAAGAYAFWLGVLCLQALVFFFCIRLAFRRPHPVHWGRYRLGILAGFGLQACASAAAFLTSFNLGPRFEAVFHYASPGAYIGATVIWLFAFAGEDTLPVSKRTDMDDIRRAIEYVDRESGRAKKDLGIRLSGRSQPEPLHSLRPDANPAKQ